MRALRIGLPLAVIAGGVVMYLIEPNAIGLEGGAMMVGAGLSILLLNWLFRVGVSGDRERDAEDRAREHFSRHGRWPDEPPPAR